MGLFDIDLPDFGDIIPKLPGSGGGGGIDIPGVPDLPKIPGVPGLGGGGGIPGIPKLGDLLKGGDGMKKFLSYNPKTWCDDHTEFSEHPVKTIVCVIIEILQLLNPLATFIQTTIGLIVDVIFELDSFTQFMIIMSPTIPIFILVGYFFDTL